MKIKIGTPIGNYNLSWETHEIKSIEENPNNNIVPYRKNKQLNKNQNELNNNLCPSTEFSRTVC